MSEELQKALMELYLKWHLGTAVFEASDEDSDNGYSLIHSADLDKLEKICLRIEQHLGKPDGVIRPGDRVAHRDKIMLGTVESVEDGLVSITMDFAPKVTHAYHWRLVYKVTPEQEAGMDTYGLPRGGKRLWPLSLSSSWPGC